MRRNTARWFFGIRVQLIIAFVIFAACTVVLVGTLFYSALVRQSIALSRSGEITQTQLVILEEQLTEGFSEIVAEYWVSLLFVLVIAGMVGAVVGHFFSRPIEELLTAMRSVQIGPNGKEGSRRLTAPITCHALHEFDALATAFNELHVRIGKQNQMLMSTLAERTVALQHSNEILRDFVYYTAHRLRTPLNIIRWSTDMLNAEERGKLNKQQREILSDLERATLSVLELTDDLQDLLMMERKTKMLLHTERLSLPDLIDEASGEAAVLAGEHQVQIEWKRPKQGEKFQIFADRPRLVQALKHIIENAVRYNVKNGTVMIRIERAKQVAPSDVRASQGIPDQRGSYFYVSIADTGVGIPMEEQSHVFQRFFRGKRARTQWTDGGGIGLSVARPTALLHGGALWFQSNKRSAGTTFVLSIPAV